MILGVVLVVLEVVLVVLEVVLQLLLLQLLLLQLLLLQLLLLQLRVLLKLPSPLGGGAEFYFPPAVASHLLNLQRDIQLASGELPEAPRSSRVRVSYS